ncbi:hypothetical protein [Aliarcobacter lanthieri]|uniref:hypothetical protein n=1 Tax=Aliarcobacter lanthieri TaxID=1355374 RepID=UPI00047C648A|nr:hypothetical protein [Aliarcobacter lanthieri]QKF59140.1 hypothetical protein ALANTH_1030 [Aliarcobacter lanthieri]
MKRLFKVIIFISIGWIGFEYFKYTFFTYDGTDKSIERMLKLVPLSQKTEFINNFDLVLANYYRKEFELDGFNVDEIRNEAIKIKRNIANNNIKFLNKYIEYLQNNNKKDSYLDFSEYGVISAPKQGYIYSKKFSIKEMKDIIKHKGDYQFYKYMLEYKIGFFEVCKYELCQCVFDEIIKRYSLREIRDFEKLSDKEMSKILLDLVNSCKNSS